MVGIHHPILVCGYQYHRKIVIKKKFIENKGDEKWNIPLKLMQE